MGSMSASDAAPLPRRGEVYFDVRGESRSMRLSWYADTGVAVFSIWQGGTCTATFRLPIADLPRMIEALQRGPRGAPGPAGRGAAHFDEPPTGVYRGDPLSGETGDHRPGRHGGYQDGREKSGPSSGSFPYGYLPTEPDVRGRGR